MDNFIGEIRLFAGTFAPQGWAVCNGSLLSIDQNDVLYSLIGTTYGGDGQTTFAIPDLRGRVPVHTTGNGYPLGAKGGVQSVTLLNSNLPVHSHTFNVSSQPATQINNAGNFLAAPVDTTPTNPKSVDFYVPGDAPGIVSQPLLPSSINVAGGSQPHENRQPYISVNYIIALVGVYPSQN